MQMSRTALGLGLTCSMTVALAGCGSDDDESGNGQTSTTSFFVTSDKSPTGNLGGLSGADARCAALASAVGLGGKTWRAYLSVESDPSNGGLATHARDRIGTGPWYNANGVLVAENLDQLHARPGDAEVFVDERGEKVPGQWAGSPTPNEHDILTGTTPEGRVMSGMTCVDWTSDSADMAAQTGHSDGLGPQMSATPPLNSWHSSHPNESCADTAPRGGAGRIYCFASN